jgi:hypothetical protein
MQGFERIGLGEIVLDLHPTEALASLESKLADAVQEMGGGDADYDDELRVLRALVAKRDARG